MDGHFAGSYVYPSAAPNGGGGMENANGGTITKFDGESNISSMNHFSISFPGDPGTAYWATYNFSGYPQFGPLWTF